MNFTGWNDQKAQKQNSSVFVSFVVMLPEVENELTSLSNEWAGLGSVKIGGNEKAFIKGFIAGLQLNDGQAQALLYEYAKVWNRAYRQELNINRKYNRAVYVANSWLRNGAKGFVQRKKIIK